MKKQILLLLATLMLTLTSCENSIVIVEEEELEKEELEEKFFYNFQIDKSYINIGDQAGSFTILVKSNHEWNATIQKPQDFSIPKIELDKCCGSGDAIITVNYSKPHRNFYYGYEESSTIVFHHKVGSNKAPKSSQTTCFVKRNKQY